MVKHVFKNTITRWVIFWVIATLLSLGTIYEYSTVTGKENFFGDTVLQQLYAIAFMFAPWFFWGALVGEFAEHRRTYSHTQGFLVICGLLALLLAVLWWSGTLILGW